MNNAERILVTLDQELDHPVTLILYGRAAIALGFDNPPAEVGRSLDVDVLLPREQVAALECDEQFWQAQAETNRKLEKEGLYLTHLFTEDQVFLQPDWRTRLVPIARPATRYLKLLRPGTIDLILTKMMRGADEIDTADMDFMIRRDRITVDQLSAAMNRVFIPDVPELKELFAKARPVVLALATTASQFNR